MLILYLLKADKNKHVKDLIFFCDDGTGVARLFVALKVINFFSSRGADLSGFHVRPDKTELFSPYHQIDKTMINNHSLDPSITIPQHHLDQITLLQPDDGIVIVGTPIGSDNWIKNYMNSQLRDVTERTTPITIHPSTQDKMILIRSITPWSRTCP